MPLSWNETMVDQGQPVRRGLNELDHGSSKLIVHFKSKVSNVLTQTPKTTYLKDYAPPAYRIPTIDLRFELGDEFTMVHSRLRIVRAESTPAGTPLALDGQHLELIALELDGIPLDADRYQVDADRLTLLDPPAEFDLAVTTRIRPQDNAALQGLYQSSGNFCTQCEAEGFRRITYFLDRPDVMAVFTTTLVADQARYPVLLSNGNPVASGETGGRPPLGDVARSLPQALLSVRRWWPAICSTSKTTSPPAPAARSRCASTSSRTTSTSATTPCIRCKQAMAWDEERFGREYDLDLYQIVAVGDFNMGAMENKGLNVFNTKYVLAKPETATDADYQGIVGVIAHEYFHNWTGNRITCRDWFQLSLKEGLDRVPRPGILQRHRLARGQAHRGCAHPARQPVPAGRRADGASGAAGFLHRNQQLLHRHRLQQGRGGDPHDADPAGPGRLPARHGPLFRAPRRAGGDLRRFRRGDGGRQRRPISASSSAGTTRPAPRN